MSRTIQDWIRKKRKAFNKSKGGNSTVAAALEEYRKCKRELKARLGRILKYSINTLRGRG